MVTELEARLINEPKSKQTRPIKAKQISSGEHTKHNQQGNMATSWTEDQQFVIEQHSRYFKRMNRYLEELKRNPETSEEEPKKPSEPLPTKTKFKKKRESTERKSPEDILAYIIFNIEETDHPITDINMKEEFKDESQLLERARAVCNDIGQLQKKTTQKNFELGWILYTAKRMSANYAAFDDQLRKCNDVIGLSLSYANKLIRFYVAFINHQRLLNTKVGFTFILENIKVIEQELELPKYDSYKMQYPATPMDIHHDNYDDEFEVTCKLKTL